VLLNGSDAKLAKIGFLALAAKWYWDTEMLDSKFTAEALSLIKSIESTLAVSGELVSAGLVTTEESASSALGRFRKANVDAVIACCFMWSEDQPLLRVLEELKETPLLLWSWTPGPQLPENLTALDLIRWSGPVAVLPCRPCLYLPSVFESGIVVGMEGDLLGTVAQLVLSRLSGQPTMFTEIFTYDETKNEILVGHAGMRDIRLARSRSAVTITPDYEYPREEAGVWMAFSVRPGPVTLLSIASTTDGIHFVVTKGEALPSEGRLQGYPNALVKLDTPLRSFFKVTTGVGTTQHWALAPGDLRKRVPQLASILGLQCTVLAGDQEA